MRVVWTLLARRVIIDQVTNTVSLIDVIEEIGLAEAPPLILGEAPGFVLHDGTSLVVTFQRDDVAVPERGEFRIGVRLPDGTMVLAGGAGTGLTSSVSFPINLGEYIGFRLTVAMQNFPYGGPGVHTIVVQEQVSENEWQTRFELPIRVSITALVAGAV